MIKLIVSFFLFSTFLSASSLTDKEIEEKTIAFCNRLIESPDSILYILQNENTIRTDVYLNGDYLYKRIEFDSLIIEAHKRNNFFLSEFRTQPKNEYIEKLAFLTFKKNDNFFYNIYSYFNYIFFGGGCNNYITYYFKVIYDEIYFSNISICQHMHPSELDE